MNSYKFLTKKTIFSALIGSDLLGNPKSLISNIKNGVKDFSNDDINNIINNNNNNNNLNNNLNNLNEISNAKIGSSFLRGTKSLMCNSLYGPPFLFFIY